MINKDHKLLHYLLQVQHFTCFAYLFLYLLFGPERTMGVVSLIGAITSITIIIVGAVRVSQGFKPARIFLAGWSVYVIGGFIHSMNWAGFLDSNPLTIYAIESGSVIEVMLMSFALAYRVKLLREEKELAETDYRAIFENSLQGVLRTSPDDRLILLNQAAAVMLGYDSPGEAMEKIANIGAVYAEISQRTGLIRRILKGETLLNNEICIRRKDGDSAWLLANYRPVFNKNGGLAYIETFCNDITLRKMVELENQELQRKALTSQEAERQRIARELHDDVAQTILSANLLLQRLYNYKNSSDLQDIADILKQSIAKVRNLSSALRPPDLDELGLTKALHSYCMDFTEREGLELDFLSAGMETMVLDESVELNLYRIVQEAFYNIARHARASRVRLRIVNSRTRLTLSIEDDGKGFVASVRLREAVAQHRMGVLGMQERVKLLGGEFNLWSEPGRGTKVVADIPIEESSR